MRRTVAVLFVASLLLAAAVATPAAGSTAGTDEPVAESAIRVDLAADGDATVTLVSVYDLSDADERDAFETLRDDEATQAELLERFADRIDGVAAAVEADAGREMTVSAESVDVRARDDRGIVTLSVTWEGLAATDGETLVVREPFASDFDPDRQLVVTIPDGATVESSTPDPTTTDGNRLTWDEETDLNGFELTISGQESETAASSDGLPGFGAPVAVVAVALAVATAMAARP